MIGFPITLPMGCQMVYRMECTSFLVPALYELVMQLELAELQQTELLVQP